MGIYVYTFQARITRISRIFNFMNYIAQPLIREIRVIRA